MLALVSWHICINVIKHATFQVYSVYPAVVILKNLQLTTGIYTRISTSYSSNDLCFQNDMLRGKTLEKKIIYKSHEFHTSFLKSSPHPSKKFVVLALLKVLLK